MPVGGRRERLGDNSLLLVQTTRPSSLAPTARQRIAASAAAVNASRLKALRSVSRGIASA
jgi:hypothetical protein